MKTPLRSSLPRSKKEPDDAPVHPNPRIAAIILAEQRELEAIERGIFRGDIWDKERDLSKMKSIDEDEEFMRSIFPDWPELPIEKEKK